MHLLYQDDASASISGSSMVRDALLVRSILNELNASFAKASWEILWKIGKILCCRLIFIDFSFMYAFEDIQRRINVMNKMKNNTFSPVYEYFFATMVEITSKRRKNSDKLSRFSFYARFSNDASCNESMLCN